MADGYQHNNIWGGRNLGSLSSTSDTSSFVSKYKISSGLFTGLYIGDYVTINDGTYNKPWVVAGFDVRLGKGDETYYVSKHHVALIPQTILFSAQMNSTNTAEGGYVGSAMYKSTLPGVDTNMKKVLGSNLIQQRCYLTNSVDTNVKSSAYNGWSGASNNISWYTVNSVLMGSIEVFGGPIFDSSAHDIMDACCQLPYFRMIISHHAGNRFVFWLRSVSCSDRFCYAGGYGDACAYYASSSFGVRPLIIIG